MEETQVVCIGAGPAGLTASYLLSKKKISVVVLEADPQYVGGISRTVNYKGYLFDIGGHRFFSKSEAVENLWTEILPDGMLERPRLSRIFYRGQFYSYPLKAFEALFKLGPAETALCLVSYLKARMHPVPDPKNIEDWVSNQFGRRLFEIFFKTYTEKVWGMKCKEISADWAAQRIKGLSLGTAVKEALLPKSKSKSKDRVIKTLIDTFRYPRRGPGMLWEAAATKTKAQGGDVRLGCQVSKIDLDKTMGTWTVTYKINGEAERQISCGHVISSAPLRELIENVTPTPQSVPYARQLKYRDFLTVGLVLKDRNLFPDNWIYIHDPSVKVGRIQNFKSWSPHMVPDKGNTFYGMEYFCFEGDGLWESTDTMLIEMASKELQYLGLAKPGDILDGCVLRQKKAYPVYDDQYQFHVDKIREELENQYPGLHLVGRNGMHKYNNQDHAMMTAMLTVENIIAGKKIYDVWAVNQDAEYHEGAASKSGASGLRSVPKKIAS